MLILGRGVGDVVDIRVGDVEFRVKIIVARRGYVRLGFDAPDAVRIRRDNAKRKFEPKRPKGLTTS